MNESGIHQNNRDDWIRTSGPLDPNEVRYQAALHPEADFVTQPSWNSVARNLTFRIIGDNAHLHKQFYVCVKASALAQTILRLR